MPKKTLGRGRTAQRQAGTRRLLDRILLLDRLLRSGRAYSLARLAEELEASERTIQRDLEYLRDRLGAEVTHDPDAGGYRYVSPTMVVPPARLTDEEILALYIASPVLAQYRGTPLEAEFQAAFSRLTSGLPRAVLTALAPVHERISVKATVPTTADVDRFRTVLRATLEGRALALVYYSAYRGATSERVVHPYALRSVDGQWYLIGWCAERRAVRVFLVSRIWSATGLAERFPRPADFDVDRLLAGAFGIVLEQEEPPTEVVVRFDDFAARTVRELVWHPSQRLSPRPEGGVEISLVLQGTAELERWVLGFGEHAEVVSPGWLRARLRDRLARALARHADPRPVDDASENDELRDDMI